MSSCNRCGKTLHGLLPGFLCPKCKSIERERDEDREREDEREEQTASALSEMLNEIDRSREQSREDIAAAAAYIADAKNNPGDYVCPSCLYRTLKKGASRCPKCHADPGRQYWIDVETKERDARLRALAAEKAAKEEWERGEPARAAAAKAAKNKAFASSILTICVVVGSIFGIVILLGKGWDAIKDGFQDMGSAGYQKRIDSGYYARQEAEKIAKNKLMAMAAEQAKADGTFKLSVGKAIPTILIPPNADFQVESNKHFAITDGNGQIVLNLSSGWNLPRNGSMEMCLMVMGIEEDTTVVIGGSHFQATPFPIRRCGR